MNVHLTAIIVVSLWTVSALAAEAFDGRWAADERACTDEAALLSPVTITPRALTWSTAACMVRTSYRVSDAWHVSARCWGEGVISEVPIKLQIRGARLILGWARARPEELRRCP